jgi:hypothetical protein
MTLPNPLQGNELIDCAKANSNQDLSIASERCGYGNNIAKFEEQLRNACQAIGVDVEGFSDLNKDREVEDMGKPAVIVAPGIDGQL